MDGGPGCFGVSWMWSGLDTRLDINPRVDAVFSNCQTNAERGADPNVGTQRRAEGYDGLWKPRECRIGVSQWRPKPLQLLSHGEEPRQWLRQVRRLVGSTFIGGTADLPACASPQPRWRTALHALRGSRQRRTGRNHHRASPHERYRVWGSRITGERSGRVYPYCASSSIRRGCRRTTAQASRLCILAPLLRDLADSNLVGCQEDLGTKLAAMGGTEC